MVTDCGDRNRRCPIVAAGPERQLSARWILGCDSAASLGWGYISSQPAVADGLRLSWPYARRTGSADTLPAATALKTRLTRSKWSGTQMRLRLLCAAPGYCEILPAIPMGGYEHQCDLCLVHACRARSFSRNRCGDCSLRSVVRPFVAK